MGQQMMKLINQRPPSLLCTIACWKMASNKESFSAPSIALNIRKLENEDEEKDRKWTFIKMTSPFLCPWHTADAASICYIMQWISHTRICDWLMKAFSSNGQVLFILLFDSFLLLCASPPILLNGVSQVYSKSNCYEPLQEWRGRPVCNLSFFSYQT